jgi:hypothetical protein
MGENLKRTLKLTPLYARPVIRGATIVLMSLFLAGCGVGALVGDGGNSAARLADTTASPSEISQVQSSALPAIATQCPPIKVRNGGEAIFSYANNKVGDPRALQFQAVIDGQSRNCVVSNGLITVKMGVVGRLLLGPSNTQNSMTLPLRFAVERDDIPVFSQVYNIPMTVTPPSQSEEFVKVVENVAIPYLGGENIVIWVGFDPQA